MITLYDANETEFRSTGLGSLPDALDCKVTEERNGKYELEMTYPRVGRHWADIQKHRIIFCKPDPYRDPQAFQIYKIQNSLKGKTKIYAEHISYRLSKIPVAPFTAPSCVLALQGLKDNAVEPCLFNFSTDKDIDSPYEQTVPATIRQRLGGDDNSILELYKGEYEFDNFDVRLWVNRGSDKGVTIRYGKNMTDFSQEESIEDTYTGVYPYWRGTIGEKDEGSLVNEEVPVTIELPEKVRYSENRDLYPIHLTLPLDLSDKWDYPPTEEELRDEADAYILRNGIGVPKVTMDVEFIALRQTEEYKNVAPLERVSLCDKVTVIFDDLNVSTTAEIVKTVYDVLKDRYDSVEIGEPKSNISQTIATQSQEIANTAVSIRSNYEEKISEATNILKGALGGHVIFGTDANGKPNEIYIMDTEDVSTAQNILRMNYQGIGFSTQGIEGPYSSAWLLNGTMDMQEINVINLIGEYIIGGTISDINRRNWWNLTTGELSINATSGQIAGSDIETEVTTEGVRQDVADVLQHFHIRPDAGLEIVTDDGTAIILSNGEVLIANAGEDLFALDDDANLELDDGDLLAINARTETTDIHGENITSGDLTLRNFMAVGNHKWLARSNGTNTTMVYVGE